MPTYRLHHRQFDAPAWTPLDLSKPVFNIGRAADNDLPLSDPLVSGHHARLQILRDQVMLIDLNSSNGVTVNGKRIPANQWVQLTPGSVFVLGRLALRLEAIADAPQPAAAPPSPQAVQSSPRPVQAPSRGRPQRTSPQPPAQVQPPVQARPRPTMRAPQAVERKPAQAAASPRRFVLPCLAVSAALLLCLVIIGAGWLLYPRLAGMLPFLGGGAVESLDPPIAVAAQTLAASAGRLQDEHGAVLEIPGEALPPEEALTLQTAQLSAGMQRELEKEYSVGSLLYSVSANSMDAVGRAALSLPAPSPDSRLAVLLDDQMLAILPIQPQNGALNVAPFLGAPQVAEGYPASAQSSLPNRYFVITPKDTTSQREGLHNRLISYSRQAESDELARCTPRIWQGNRCWMNQAGSVLVLYWNREIPADMSTSDPLQPPAVIGEMIAAIADVMSKYQKAGFTAAAISSSNPVYIVISASETEPNYSPKTGNVYLGWNVVKEITQVKDICTLGHELFHWIEDEEYAMNAAAMLGFRSWWLEMAADNGAYLLDAPLCLGDTLSTYGQAEVGSLLAWQAAPFEWDWGEGARYIQSLQMYLAICEGNTHCAVTPAEFSTFINSGSYPSSTQLDRYSAAADDMGLYLLGNAPLFARSDAPILPQFKKGQGYGDYIWLKDKNGATLDLSLSSQRITQPGTLEARVDTQIAKGAVYPLWVSNGKGSPLGGGDGFTTLPGILTVEAGAPLWYSLNHGSAVFHDGGKELIIGAISDKLGVGLARLVAVAPSEAKQLRATVKVVDLSGDWLNKLSNPVIIAKNCEDSGGDSGEEEDGDLQSVDLVAFFSGYGAYVEDSEKGDGSHYTWQGELPEGIPATSEITVAPDKITLEYAVTIPKSEESGAWLPPSRLLAQGGLAEIGQRLAPSAAAPGISWMPGWPWLAALLTVGGLAALGWLRPRLGRRQLITARLALLCLLFLGVGNLLTGCFGLELWGTFSGTYTYDRLEHIDASNPPAAAASFPSATWLVKGKGEIIYDLHILVTTTDDQGNETSEESVCYVQFSADLEGLVGPADMAPAPDTSGEE